jgi:hypothetical protein
MEYLNNETPELKRKQQIIRYLDGVGVDPPESDSLEDYENALIYARGIKRRRHLGLGDNASEEEVRVILDANRKAELLQYLDLADNASEEEIEYRQSIVDDAQKLADLRNESRKYFYSSSEGHKKSLRVIQHRMLGLPDNASEEEYMAARKELSNLRKRRSLGLPDNASDEDIDEARKKFQEEDIQDCSNEERAAREIIRHSYKIRTLLSLPADTPDEITKFKYRVWEQNGLINGPII